MMVAKVAQSGRPRGQPRQRDEKDIRPLSAVRVGAQKHTPTRRHRRWRIHVRFLRPRVYPVVGRKRIRPPIGPEGDEYRTSFATVGGVWLGVCDTPLHRVHDWIRETHTSRRRVGPRGWPDFAITPTPTPPACPLYIMYRPRPGGATIARPVFHTPRKEHPEKQTRIFVH